MFGNAARLIDAGLIDAAVVGGVDSLCLTTLYGFNSLELLAADICRPWDADRHGLSIGEARRVRAARARAVATRREGLLLGVGESSDGYHMCSPHPEGAGAVEAMRAALAGAQLAAGAIDYINLHGTATPSNDAAEDRAVVRGVRHDTPCSSTKGATGHTLGAAGGVEAAISLLALRHGFMPGGLNCAHARPGAAAPTTCSESVDARLRTRAQQFLRLRRLEREPRVRAARDERRCTGRILQGIGLLGPGIASWAGGAAAAARRASRMRPQPTVLPPPARLPSAERRRAGAAVKLAMAVADEAVRAGRDRPAARWPPCSHRRAAKA